MDLLARSAIKAKLRTDLKRFHIPGQKKAPARDLGAMELGPFGVALGEGHRENLATARTFLIAPSEAAPTLVGARANRPPSSGRHLSHGVCQARELFRRAAKNGILRLRAKLCPVEQARLLRWPCANHRPRKEERLSREASWKSRRTRGKRAPACEIPANRGPRSPPRPTLAAARLTGLRNSNIRNCRKFPHYHMLVFCKFPLPRRERAATPKPPLDFPEQNFLEGRSRLF